MKHTKITQTYYEYEFSYSEVAQALNEIYNLDLPESIMPVVDWRVDNELCGKPLRGLIIEYEAKRKAKKAK